jgi:hypothetical protein
MEERDRGMRRTTRDLMMAHSGLGGDEGKGDEWMNV